MEQMQNAWQIFLNLRLFIWSKKINKFNYPSVYSIFFMDINKQLEYKIYESFPSKIDLRFRNPCQVLHAVLAVHFCVLRKIFPCVHPKKNAKDNIQITE